ncbi:hypothetical protein B0A48_02743 [Cryoendolithus antarcticus]|uniref:Uncharacterized protein n=1 Tax=Cryoendolithus antarcticus TaxID=1507870 RepID=A0A1V8TLB1_9PEZI|nr:hypothetical protein B0A48_02743 [Cryoendolithus antarcticus]
MASLRLLTRGPGFASHSKQLQSRLLLSIGLRHASTAPPPKPRLLEKPERYNPPSHPSRARGQRPSIGAPLSEEERRAQRRRQYPHMMPPEGTFMHWFLTHRTLHMWITVSILSTLILTIWTQDFVNTTPFRDLLPPNSLALSHPIQFVRQYIHVYQLHSENLSREVSERRRQKVEDVQKRAQFRKAHGLEEPEGVFGGWTAKADEEVLGGGMREGGMPGEVGPDLAIVDQSPVARDVVATEAAEKQPEIYVDFEGKERPVQEAKKWFGIW